MAILTPFTAAKMGGEGPHQNVFMDAITFPGDSAYAAGGTAAFQDYFHSKGEPYQGRSILHVDGWGYSGGKLYIFRYNHATKKLMMFDGATGAEVANGDMSAVTVNATVWSE